MAAVASRYEAVRRQVADAADAVGRDPHEVLVVAVTKTVGIDDIRQALAAGIEDFGENRVQEFLGKYGLFPTAHWHFIGTLQTNKVKDVVGRASLIRPVCRRSRERPGSARRERRGDLGEHRRGAEPLEPPARVGEPLCRGVAVAEP